MERYPKDKREEVPSPSAVRQGIGIEMLELE